MKKNTYVIGKCIAIIYRINDDKKIIDSQDKDYSDEQFKYQLNFQKDFLNQFIRR